MDYSEYVARLSTYQDIDLKETERSYLSRIISGREPGYGLSSYLRLKRQSVAWKDDQIVLKKESCKITFEMLDYVRTADNSQDKRRYAKQLEENLEWSAKLLLFKLTIMYNESNLLSATSNIIDENAKVALYQLEDTMRTVLYNDKMFTRQLNMIEAEFREGYNALVGPK